MRRSFFHVQFAVHDRNSASRILQILIFIVCHRDWKNRQQWYQRTVHRSSWSIQEKSRETKTKYSQFFPFVIHFIFTIGDMTDNLLSLTVVSWNEYLDYKWYISKNYCALSNFKIEVRFKNSSSGFLLLSVIQIIFILCAWRINCLSDQYHVWWES